MSRTVLLILVCFIPLIAKAKKFTTSATIVIVPVERPKCEKEKTDTDKRLCEYE